MTRERGYDIACKLADLGFSTSFSIASVNDWRRGREQWSNVSINEHSLDAERMHKLTEFVREEDLVLTLLHPGTLSVFEKAPPPRPSILR